MYRPRMGLAYSVFLHSSLWVVVCVEGLCVIRLDLVIACLCSVVLLSHSSQIFA